MQNEFKEKCIVFIEKYLPSCKAAMITGSASVSDMDQNSDIDILILDDNISRDYFESIHFDGYVFDCIVLPSIMVGDILNQEYNTGVNTYISMLSKGVILRDNINVLEQLKKYAINLDTLGPKQIDGHTKRTTLFKAYGLYNDLEASREWNESLHIALDLFNSLVTLNLSLHTYWRGSGKWKYRSLNKFDSNFAESITKSFTKLVSEKNKSDFLHLAKTSLLSFGKKPKQFSSRYFHFIVTNNLLTISIKSGSSNKVVYEYYLKKLSDKLRLFESSISFFYIYNDNSILDESNYLIFIKGENETLNHIINPLINSFVVEQKDNLVANGIVSTFNYQFDPESIFEPHQVYEIMEPVFVYFKRFHEWMEGYNENRALTYITLFHLSFGSKLGLSIEQYSNFNKFLLEKSLPLVLDAERKESFSSVEQKRIAKLTHYHQIFENQKASLVDNFSGIYDDWGTIKNENIEEFLAEGISLLCSAYNNLDNDFFQEYFVPQYKLNQLEYKLSDFEKKCWISLASTLNVLYGSALLSADQKSYLYFSTTKLLTSLENRII